MNPSIIVLTAILLSAIFALLAYITWQLRFKHTERDELIRLRLENESLQSIKHALTTKHEALEVLKIEHAKLTSELTHQQNSAAEKIKLMEHSEKRLATEFENLANRIFESKGKAFADQNHERINALLQPLREQIHTFRKRIDDVHQQDTAQTAKLLEQVRALQQSSNKVSEEANLLAKAIKGDTKKQGDWGEFVIERLLEAAGLENGREYESQVAIRAHDGALQRPDFIVYLPSKKAVFIDAKVSLTAYARFAAAEDETTRRNMLKEHVQSVRRHIDELSKRAYDDLLGNRTLDFVVLCIPLEPAYQTALQADEKLLQDLARTNVVITGPSTLLITLKLIAQIWRREHENRNAESIAERAGRMHDQIALVYEAMDDAAKRLKGTSESFALAMNRLKDGRGNLISRANELRKLGAKVNKQLPASQDCDEGE